MPVNTQTGLPAYNALETKLNFYSHLLGAILALIGSGFMLAKVAGGGLWQNIVSVTVYLLSLINLYTMSTVYHYQTKEDKIRKLQKTDHLSISLLIAGSCTPFFVISVGGVLGTAVICVIWALSLLALVLNIVNVRKFRAVTMVCYILCGWAPIVISPQLWVALTPSGFSLLLAGGLFYTVGLTFYGLNKYNYTHAIWHLFVLAGSILHYFAVYFFVL